MFPFFLLSGGTSQNEKLDNTKQDNTNRTKNAPEENSFGAFAFGGYCELYGWGPPV